MTGRDTRIDNAKGLLIILVVLGHLVWPVPNTDGGADGLYFFIYLFHMPMFALVSGYLSRVETGWSAVVKNGRLLLVPYAVFVLLHWLTLWLLGKEPYPFTEGHYGLWYLLSLFCWRLALPYVRRLPLALPATIALGLAAGFVPFIGMELSLSRTIVFLPFFLAGHLLREKGQSPVTIFGRRQSPLMMGMVAGQVMLLATLLLMVVSAAFLSGYDLHAMLYGNRGYAALGPPVMVGFIARIIQYAAAFAAGLAVLGMAPDQENPVTRMGRHSLHVYLLHSALLVPYRAVPAAYGMVGSNAWLLLPAAVLVAWLLSSSPVVRATRRLVAPLPPVK